MDASSARLLRQPGNELFNFFTHHHHQICQLVDHHHNVGQALERLWVVWRQAERVHDERFARCGFVYFGVVASQISHAHFAQ